MCISSLTGAYSSLPKPVPSSSAVCKSIVLCITIAALAQLPSTDAVPVPMAIASAAPSTTVALKAAGAFLLGINPLTAVIVGASVSMGVFASWVLYQATPSPDTPLLSIASRQALPKSHDGSTEAIAMHMPF